MQADRAGDELLEAASRNPFAAAAAAPLHAHSRRLWYRFQHDGDLGRSAHLHARMLRAAAAGEEAAAAEAAEALVDYLDTFARTALALD